MADMPEDQQCEAVELGTDNDEFVANEQAQYNAIMTKSVPEPRIIYIE